MTVEILNYRASAVKPTENPAGGVDVYVDLNGIETCDVYMPTNKKTTLRVFQVANEKQELVRVLNAPVLARVMLPLGIGIRDVDGKRAYGLLFLDTQLAVESGIQLATGAPVLVDSETEIVVPILNISDRIRQIRHGEKIGRLVILP